MKMSWISRLMSNFSHSANESQSAIENVTPEDEKQLELRRLVSDLKSYVDNIVLEDDYPEPRGILGVGLNKGGVGSKSTLSDFALSICIYKLDMTWKTRK